MKMILENEELEGWVLQTIQEYAGVLSGQLWNYLPGYAGSRHERRS